MAPILLLLLLANSVASPFRQPGSGHLQQGLLQATMGLFGIEPKVATGTPSAIEKQSIPREDTLFAAGCGLALVGLYAFRSKKVSKSDK
jgi:hypothetical protein